MKIALVMQGGSQWMGGATYVLNWSRVLCAHVPAPDVHLVCESEEQREIAARSAASLPVLSHPGQLGFARRVLNSAAFRVTGGRPSLSALLAREPFDFVFPAFPGVGVRSRYPYAAWIPDLQHRHLPEFFSARDHRKLDGHFRRLARHSRALVVSSQAVLDDLLEFEPRAREHTHVLRFYTLSEPGWFVGDPLEVQRKYGLPDRFFLVCNQFWRHKNHETLFRAMARLRDTGVVLVATGALDDYRAPGYADQVRRWIAELGIEPHVRLLGLIPRLDQIQLLRRSLAVVQPSLFEGWSTVIEDARALGRPVLASSLAVHREQLGPDAQLFSPRDDAALAELMRATWQTGTEGPDPASETRARAFTAHAIEQMRSSFFALAARARSA